MNRIKLREEPTAKQVVQADSGHKEGCKENYEQELTVCVGVWGGGGGKGKENIRRRTG